VNALVEDHCKESALAINWLLFGDSGLTAYDNRPFFQRFVMRQASVNEHVKCIVKTSDLISASVHTCNVRTHTKDTNGSIVKGSYNRNGPTDVAVLHHYFTKTREEFIQKRNRGRADIDQVRPMSNFDAHNMNEVFDLSAWTFFRHTTFDADS
jgi:hypothetical protein